MTLSQSIPLLIIVAFLVITLLGAILAAKNANTLREYVIGDKQFQTSMLVMTVLVTSYGGGGLVRSIEQIYATGLPWIYIACLPIFSFGFISFLASRAELFMHNLSMPETIGRVYGKHARFIAALSGICSSVAVISIQISVMSRAIGMFMPALSAKLVVLFAAFILIFYTTVGGIRIATITQVCYLITFSIVLPLVLYWLILKNRSLPPDTIQVLGAQAKFQSSIAFNWDLNLVAMVMIGLSGPVSYIEPAIVHRMYMSADHFQATRVFFYAGLFSILIQIMIISMPLLVYVGAPDLPTSGVWSYIIASMPPVLQGGLAIAFLALSMSTADAQLNSCAVMVSHDMVHCLTGKRGFAYERQLQLAKITTVVVGICATLLSFCLNDILALLKLHFDFYIPIITAPFVLALWGFRGAAHTALIGMATGLVAIIAWKLWVESQTGINGAFLCMMANGLAMAAAHRWLKKKKQ